MDNVGSSVLRKVHSLSDLELATLSCLIAEQHCIIRAHHDLLDSLEQELSLVSKSIFGLPVAVISCTTDTRLDEFGETILVEKASDVTNDDENKKQLPPITSIRSTSPKITRRTSLFPSADSWQIANIIVARNLHQASSQMQIQVLELLRGKRIYTRTSVHVAPKRFLFIALLPTDSDAELNNHLTDQFFISHLHSKEDELPHVASASSDSSRFDRPGTARLESLTPNEDTRSSSGMAINSSVFSKTEIDHLVDLANFVSLTAEIRAYMHNIVVFMRMNRAVAGGVSSLATRHFHLLVRTLSPLHGLDYVPPSLVALAARKIYPHRIVLTTMENERSMQWGSSLEAIKDELEGITVEDVIEDVLSNVEVPL